MCLLNLFILRAKNYERQTDELLENTKLWTILSIMFRETLFINYYWKCLIFLLEKHKLWPFLLVREIIYWLEYRWMAMRLMLSANLMRTYSSHLLQVKIKYLKQDISLLYQPPGSLWTIKSQACFHQYLS